MSDAPVSAPSSAASSAPAGGAAPEAPKPHHAALQPREQGKFAGPPDPTKAAPVAGTEAPPAPKRYKVGGREFESPDDLAAYAAEKDAEARALDDYRKREAAAQKRAAELEALTKDPRKAVTPELEDEIVLRRVRAFQEQEALRNMSPEAREFYLARKQLEQEKAALAAEKAERARVEAEAKQKAEEEATERQKAAAREEMKATIGEAMELAGLDANNPWDFQRVAFVMRGAAERGVVYPPEVIARKVKQGIQHEQATRLKSAKPADLLSVPELVASLNGIEDAATLRLLQPLGEKLRRLHLESIGAKPAPSPGAAPATLGTGVVDMEEPPPGSPLWKEYFRRKAKQG